jgi:hypothetical protein
VPEDWVLGLSDIVQSTAAIEAGRYKAVNTAAAAVIASVANALGSSGFPFVFAGDGASFALAPDQAESGRVALTAVAAWVRDELRLEMRVALVPVAAARDNGLDVRIARFAPSADVSYAMFAGGGLAWAERQMKAGAFALPPAPDGRRPDLTGLSCRFDEIGAERGVILSLIVVPAGSDLGAFEDLITRILELAEGSAKSGRPVPDGGPALHWPPSGIDIEAKTLPLHRRLPAAAYLWTGLRTLASDLIFRSGVRLGAFDPSRYRRQLVENTDFRKFDDGLRMTLDCRAEVADQLESMLAEAEAAGVARSGTHRQTAALMTCFVPSPTRADHVHFVDGAMGGYAAAARLIKGIEAN